MNRRHLFGLACGATLLLAACGSDKETESTSAAPAASEAPAATEAAGTEAPAENAITIEGAWARTSPMAATAGAAYMQITSAVDDQLLSASVDPSIAPTVQIHETVMADGDTMDTSMTGDTMATMDTMATGDTMAPAMEMRPVDFIDLPAGEMVALQPGGYHIMIIDLVKPLEVGQTLTITLTFKNAGEIAVDVPVLDEAP